MALLLLKFTKKTDFHIKNQLLKQLVHLNAFPLKNQLIFTLNFIRF